MIIPLVSSIEYSELSCLSAHEIVALKSTCKILIIVNSKINTCRFLELVCIFGSPNLAQPPEYRSKESKSIGLISNNSDFGFSSASKYWHSDSTFLAQPARMTFLKCNEAPSQGGRTFFIDTQLAYERLDCDKKKFVEKMIGVHSLREVYQKTYNDRGLKKLDLNFFNPFPDQEHDIVLRNSRNEIRSLYLNEKYLTRIKGYDLQESNNITSYLLNHSVSKSNIYKHSWKKNDILIWDNQLVMHKAEPVNNGVKICERACTS
ncbi:MAG: TauD/TfdA family dioxygenase [Endozoicomonas sp. (ex Botrylloides leachii)]|nr:TauD/TfdA family dioxygenase [Endozoicomonas sp. (ex Botrylloides leachii)]